MGYEESKALDMAKRVLLPTWDVFDERFSEAEIKAGKLFSLLRRAVLLMTQQSDDASI